MDWYRVKVKLRLALAGKKVAHRLLGANPILCITNCEVNMITQQYLHEALTYDTKTGIFHWKIRPSHHFKSETYWKRMNKTHAGKTTGTDNKKGYLVIGIHGDCYYAHRLAWFYIHGVMPKYIDHINHNRSDNRIINLRDVTYVDNCRNRKISEKNTSGATGIRKSGNIWQARIKHEQKDIHIGNFKTFDEAVIARKLKESHLGFHKNHGE